jgi:hypothetical protein
MKRVFVWFAVLVAVFGVALYMAERKGLSAGFALPSVVSPLLAVKVGSEERRRARFTTYMSKTHYKALLEISEKTGIPISDLIGQALDAYLKEKLGILDEYDMPPIDIEFIRRKALEDKQAQKSVTKL